MAIKESIALSIDRTVASPHDHTDEIMTIRNFLFTTLLLLGAIATVTRAHGAAPNPIPTHADVSYGPSPHQLMDIHLPTSGCGPFPVLIWFGGIWEPSKHA